MGPTSLAHTSHPFWSKVLSTAAQLVPYGGVPFDVTPPNPTRATNTQVSRSLQGPRPRRENPASTSSVDYGIDSHHSEVHAGRRNESTLNDQRVDPIQAESVQEEWPRAKDTKRAKAKVRVDRAVQGCKRWARKVTGDKKNVPGNRDSQQYVAEWVEEVHSAAESLDGQDVEDRKPGRRARAWERFGRLRFGL